MTPPRWVDTDGRPLPTVPVCDVVPPHPSSAMTVEDVRRNGWIIYMTTIVVHWCRHGRRGFQFLVRTGSVIWCR